MMPCQRIWCLVRLLIVLVREHPVVLVVSWLWNKAETRV